MENLRQHHQTTHDHFMDKLTMHKRDIDDQLMQERSSRESIREGFLHRMDKANGEMREEIETAVRSQEGHLVVVRQALSDQKTALVQEVTAERAARVSDRANVDHQIHNLRDAVRKEIATLNSAHQGNTESFRMLMDQYKEDARTTEARLKGIMGDIRGEFGRECQDLRHNLSEVRQEVLSADLGRDFQHHVSRIEFEKEKNRLWEALDTHTHNIDDKKTKAAQILNPVMVTPPMLQAIGSVRVMPTTNTGIASPRPVFSDAGISSPRPLFSDLKGH
jgi:hypothetical protein